MKILNETKNSFSVFYVISSKKKNEKKFRSVNNPRFISRFLEIIPEFAGIL